MEAGCLRTDAEEKRVQGFLATIISVFKRLCSTKKLPIGLPNENNYLRQVGYVFIGVS